MFAASVTAVYRAMTPLLDKFLDDGWLAETALTFVDLIGALNLFRGPCGDTLPVAVPSDTAGVDPVDHDGVPQCQCNLYTAP